MMTAWILNTASLFTTTIATFLILLCAYKAPNWADDALPLKAKLAYAKHRKLLTASVAILALWLLLQCLSVILL